MVGAVPGDHGATVTWLAPLASPAPIVAYVVTPFIGQVAQPETRFNSAATTETVTGLANGSTYTFHVTAINALGNDSASSNASNPVTPPGVTAVSAGDDDTCALIADGTIDCWGNNNDGQLGIGDTPSQTTPVQVPGITTATAISVGSLHTCALLTGGTIDCWGLNEHGQLGDGTTNPSSTPVQVPGITTATAVFAGSGYYTCALLVGGTVECWGAIPDAAGDQSNISLTPVAISPITTATTVATGIYDACALLADGTIDCWGANYHGELGTGGQPPMVGSDSPVQVNGITTATGIAGSYDDTCAALTGGTVDCWGLDNSGQLGNGTTTGADPNPLPGAVTGIASATNVTAGYLHVCALIADGTIDCWGSNNDGELGDGTTNQSSLPVQVTGISIATNVTAGGSHTCAVLTTHTVDCWGFDQDGQLGDGTTGSSTTPVAVL
jgi:alpha-tubulin suppressor-like RCC1 family protein